MFMAWMERSSGGTASREWGMVRASRYGPARITLRSLEPKGWFPFSRGQAR